MTETVAAASPRVCAVALRSAAAASFAVRTSRAIRWSCFDALHELVVVDDLGEARGRDDEGERVGRLVDVRLPHTSLQDVHRARVLALEAHEPARLLPEERGEPLEPLALARELRLQLVEARLRGVHSRLRGPELVDDRRELGRQHAFLLLRGLDFRAQLGDPLVDALLLGLDVLPRGRRDQSRRNERKRSQGKRERENRDEQRPPSHAH